jgi:putative metallohydrolase (TIGR04338 family)
MRDMQRQKLYDAEEIAFGQAKETMTLHEAQALVDRVLASKVIRRQYPRAIYRLGVEDGRSRRRGGYFARWDASVIRLPRRTRCKWYVLHEIAHHLSYDRREPAHGWQFAACYLHLVRVYMGKSSEQALKDAFKLKRVRYRKPRSRTMTDEQRQAARERMLAWHAKRAA